MADYEYYPEDTFVVQYKYQEWIDFPNCCSRHGLLNSETFRDDKGYTIAYPFDEHNAEEAIYCLKFYLASGSHYAEGYRIIDRRSGDVVWSSSLTEYALSVTLNPQEEQMSDVDQPLQIPRQTLIDTLNGRLAEEQQKRADADAAAAARRQVVLDAVAKLSTDQVANILDAFVQSDPDRLVKFADDVVENSKYVTKSLEPSYTESSIEKYVRVLTLATNDNIEVTPRDPVYPLL